MERSSSFSSRVLDYWDRYEKYIFVILLCVNIVPVIGVDYFFTGDGPAHLYNANLISQLLDDPQGRASEFFSLRWELIPNLGGHALLVLFKSFFSAAAAEKMVYALCLILLPLGFRYFIKVLAPAQVLWCYFIFPLTHNFCFYIGFQSFSLGLGCMLFTIGFLLQFWKSANVRSALILTLLLFVTAVFHLFTAVLSFVVIAVFLAFQKWDSAFWKRARLLVPISIPTVCFCLYYLLSGSEKSSLVMRPFLDSLNELLIARMLITLDFSEKVFSLIFAVIVGAALIYSLLRKPVTPLRWSSKFVLISSLVVLVLYFIFPDQLATGGYISFRLLLSFYILLALWLVINLRRSFLAFLLMMGLIALEIFMVEYHDDEASKLSDDASKINKAAQYIPEGSTVLPLNYSPHWLHYNIGLYPGGVRDLIVLDNYEAMTNHFPLMWKEKSFPGEKLGDFAYSKRPTLSLYPYESTSGQQLDAVIRWKYSPSFDDPKTASTDSILNLHFTKAYSTDMEDLQVFIRKE